MICGRMRRGILIIFFLCVWCVIFEIVQATTTGTGNHHHHIINNNNNNGGEGEEAELAAGGFVVRKESRRTLVSTENGEIVAARVGDGSSYHLVHFFTMDPNSLFLPVLLHSDMVFYVHTGSGKLGWTEENELKSADLGRGDVYRLKEGAVFFIHSNLDTTERRKLRIHAIFANSHHEPPTGPYSSIRDLVLGFDKKLLQAAFQVPEEEIEELFNRGSPPAIIHGVSKTPKRAWQMETKILGSRLLGSTSTYNIFEVNKKKGKGSSVKLFNLFNEDKDFKNGYGWSTAVTRKKLSVLKDTDIGLFMVNLTTGSMMGPHWNPVATEIAVVLQGRGMVRVVCSSVSNDTGCKNMRFEVEEGDVFAVPRFHPMAQMAFNNQTFVFMGFSTSAKKNHPQYFAGQASVLRTLSKQVLAMSFNVKNTTLDQLLASQQESVILGCISCAEEELSILEEARRRKQEEEAKEREEEEAKRQEEERKRQQEEEEEAEAKRQEQERERQEEEEAEAKRQEEERKRQEEEEAEAKRQEEERKRQEEEEAEAKRQEEERERQEEEAEAKRQEEERKEQEEEEEEAEEERRRQEERRQEEEEAAKREAEESARREEEERERREEAAKRREAEEERRRQEEEMARREEEERQRREAEEEHRQREEEREEEHGRRRRSEEEEAEEEERTREQEEEREEEGRERWHKEE